MREMKHVELFGFDEKSLLAVEKEADGKWRVWTGDEWKFQLNTYLDALRYALRLGGDKVGQAVWHEELQCNGYIHVTEVQPSYEEKRVAGYE